MLQNRMILFFYQTLCSILLCHQGQVFLTEQLCCNCTHMRKRGFWWFAHLGMADKAHWFLCKKSFGAQSDFRRLSLKEMGFFAGAKDHFQAPLPWSKCKTLQGFVLGMK